MAASLTERRQQILKMVIQEFIETATPVASDTLVRKYGLHISSATVRNELATLEELGYLTHQHTSAGRMPTDAGYRYFVENLMERAPLPLAEQRTIRHQFYQVRGELDQWIHLAGAVLARTAQNASLVTPPRADQLRFKSIELIPIHDTMALAVMVFQGGTIKQQTLTIDEVHSADELRRTAGKITDYCLDQTVIAIEEALANPAKQADPPWNDFERLMLDFMVRAIQLYDDQIKEQIYSDGLIEMLSQPEFIPSLVRGEGAERAVERMRRALELLKSGRGLGPLIPQVLASEGVQVIIGGEHSEDTMREYSVVLARYGVDGSVTGVLGVIGPTRMAYPRSISTVRYISSVMSDLMGEIYGTENRSPESGQGT